MKEHTTEEALRLIKIAEEELIRGEAREETVLKTLKEKYGINTIAEGDKKLDSIYDQIELHEKDLAAKKTKLEEEFPWE